MGLVLPDFTMGENVSTATRTWWLISEAEYTYKLRKRFIPLRLEYKYEPDGWLGIMVGTKLWFDFSVEDRFDASVQGLLREMQSAASHQGASVASFSSRHMNEVPISHSRKPA